VDLERLRKEKKEKSRHVLVRSFSHAALSFLLCAILDREVGRSSYIAGWFKVQFCISLSSMHARPDMEEGENSMPFPLRREFF